jgi:hypothetical protein
MLAGAYLNLDLGEIGQLGVVEDLRGALPGGFDHYCPLDLLAPLLERQISLCTRV